ncbi:MAG: biotin-dependent carboxyltransferase family protein [Acidobacteriota bacterium]|nr:biotin-dependent carboxyltransferase family protein [Acidobacteriota bacterium]
MSVTVVRPGMLTTVQDRGRHGFQHVGVPVAGPMDWWSHDAANRLAGNDSGCATLEVTLIGPELELGRSAIAAVVGAHFELTVSGRAVPMNQAFAVAAGARLSLGARSFGARAYLALDGGFDVPMTMGSRATHVRARLGGHEGRALQRGDVIALGPSQAPVPGAGVAVPSHARVAPPATLRAIAGPDTPPAAFWDAVFTISPQSDRMGYRLDGPAIGAAGDHLSSGVAMGTVQVTPSGTCVLLMADRATSGGYARAATVITADLPLAGQLAPGDTLRFTRITPAAARAAAATVHSLLPPRQS